MAKDFELSSDTTSLTEKKIFDRYNKLRITKPDLYSENEYSIAEIIFDTMSQFKQLDIITSVALFCILVL